MWTSDLQSAGDSLQLQSDDQAAAAAAAAAAGAVPKTDDVHPHHSTQVDLSPASDLHRQTWPRDINRTMAD